MNFKLSSSLFDRGKETIEVTGSAKKVTGAMGIGGKNSGYRDAGLRTPAKYNGAAKTLDQIFVNHAVNGLCRENAIYGELKVDGEVYRFVCENTHTTPGVTEIKNFRIAYEQERLHGFAKVLPIVLYALRNNTEYEETVELFEKIKEEYSSTTVADPTDVLVFCDSIYYGIAKATINDVEVIENEPTIIEEVKAGIRSGEYNTFDILDDIDKVPALSVKVKAKKKTEKTATPVFDFEKIKNGEMIIPFEWDEEQKRNIKPLSTLRNFVPTEVYYDTINKIKTRLEKVMLRMDAGMTGMDAIGNDYVNLLIHGVPGTGKTTMIHAAAASLGLPVTFVAPDKDGERDTYEGLLGVDESGNFSYRETNFLKAFQKGGIIILEEINLADQNRIFGALGQAIEAPFQIQKFNGIETVQRHPLCVIIATMNVGTNGSLELNEALASRFKQKYELPDPTKTDCINILMKHNDNRKICTWVYDVYSKVLDYIKSPKGCSDLVRNVSLRSCIGALEEIEEGKDPKRAIKNTIIGDITIAGFGEMADDIYKNVVMGYRDLIY